MRVGRTGQERVPSRAYRAVRIRQQVGVGKGRESTASRAGAGVLPAVIFVTEVDVPGVPSLDGGHDRGVHDTVVVALRAASSSVSGRPDAPLAKPDRARRVFTPSP